MDVKNLQSLLQISKRIRIRVLEYQNRIKVLNKISNISATLSSFRNLVTVRGSIKINSYDELKAVFSSELRHFKVIIKPKAILDFYDKHINASIYDGTSKIIIGEKILLPDDLRDSIFDHFYVDTLIGMLKNSNNLSEYDYKLYYHDYIQVNENMRVRQTLNCHGVFRSLIRLQFGVDRVTYYNDATKAMIRLIDYLSENSVTDKIYLGVLGDLASIICKRSFPKSLYSNWSARSFLTLLTVADIFSRSNNIQNIYYHNFCLMESADIWHFLQYRNINMHRIIIPLNMIGGYVDYKHVVNGLKEFGIFVNEETSQQIGDIVKEWFDNYHLERLYVWYYNKPTNLPDDHRIIYLQNRAFF